MKLILFLLLLLPDPGGPTITPQAINEQFYGKVIKIITNYFMTGENMHKIIFSKDLRYCAEDIMLIIEAINHKDQWTIKMLDSFGKVTDSVIWPGTQSLCLSIVPETILKNETIIQPFVTQYCALQVNSIFIGVCLPTSCSEKIVNGLSYLYRRITRNFFPFVQLQCFSETSSGYLNDTYAFHCILFCLILLVIMILGTTYDIMLRLHIRRNSDSFQEDKSAYYRTKNITMQIINLKPIEEAVHQKLTCTKKKEIFEMQLQKEIKQLGWMGHFLFSFSIFTNLKNLFSIKTDENQIQCLNGLRVLAILTIVYGHVWLLTNFLVDNKLSVPYIIESLSLSLIINGAPLAVDTFFLMSGLLLTYIYLKKIEKEHYVSWFKFYLDRLLRVSPSYWFTTFVIFLGFFLRKRFGPLDLQKTYGIQNCKVNWWRTILYVSNSKPYLQECFGVEWYIATDMQFYWLSPILLHLFVKDKRMAVRVASVTVIASSVITAIIGYYYDIAMSLPKNSTAGSHYLRGLQHYFEEIYIKPYCRITPFIFGMMVGWLLFKTKLQIHLKKLHVVLLWCLAFACFIGITLIPYWFELSRTTSSIYLLFMYILWSFAASIVIILCATGNGGIMNSFLSWSGWQPFSRLTYGVYLLHIIVIFYYNDIKQRLPHLSFPHFNMIFMCLITSSFAFSTLLNLAIESPIANLLRSKTRNTKFNVTKLDKVT